MGHLIPNGHLGQAEASPAAVFCGSFYFGLGLSHIAKPGFFSHTNGLQSIEERLGLFAKRFFHGERRPDVGADLKHFGEWDGSMSSVLVVAVAHPLSVEVDLAVSSVHGVVGCHPFFHACHQRGELECRTGLHSRADGVVEVLPIFNSVLAHFVTGEVGDGFDETGGDFRNDDRPPCGVVPSQLLLQGVRRDVLKMQIEAGHHVESFDRSHQELIGDRHPLVAGNFA